MKILGLSSTLNGHSFNCGILRNAQKRWLPLGSSFTVSDLTSLPLYNPAYFNLPTLPIPVRKFYNEVRMCDAIVFASTEYPLSPTYGISAPLKNALDWASTARNGPQGRFCNILKGKPVAIIGAGLRYGQCDTAKASSLSRMCDWLQMDLLKAPEIALDLSHHKTLFDMDSTDVSDSEMDGLIGKVLSKLAAHTTARKPYRPPLRWVPGQSADYTQEHGQIRPKINFPACKSQRSMSTATRAAPSARPEDGTLETTTSVTDAQAAAAFQWYQDSIDAHKHSGCGHAGSVDMNPFDEYGLFNEVLGDRVREPLPPGLIMISEGVYAKDGSQHSADCSVQSQSHNESELPKAYSYDYDQITHPYPQGRSPHPVEIERETIKAAHPAPTPESAPPVGTTGASNGVSSIDLGVDPIVPRVAVQSQSERAPERTRRRLEELISRLRVLLYGPELPVNSADVDGIVDMQGHETAHGRATPSSSSPAAAQAQAQAPAPAPQYQLRPGANPPEIQRVYDDVYSQEDLQAISDFMEELHEQDQGENMTRGDASGPQSFRNSTSGGDMPACGSEPIFIPMDSQAPDTPAETVMRPPPHVKVDLKQTVIPANRIHITDPDEEVHPSSGPAVHWVYTPTASSAADSTVREKPPATDQTEVEDHWGDYAHMLVASGRKADGAFYQSPPRMQHIPTPGGTDNVSTWDDAIAIAGALHSGLPPKTTNSGTRTRSEGEKVRALMAHRASEIERKPVPETHTDTAHREWCEQLRALTAQKREESIDLSNEGISYSSLGTDGMAPALAGNTFHRLPTHHPFSIALHSEPSQSQVNVGVGHGGGFGYEYSSSSRESQDENGYYHGDEDSECMLTSPVAGNYPNWYGERGYFEV